MRDSRQSEGASLLELAGRCEDHAIRLTQNSFSGFDNMRHGKVSLREALHEAADSFACAAALRALADAQTQSVSPLSNEDL